MSITPATPTARTVALGNRQIHLHEFGAGPPGVIGGGEGLVRRDVVPRRARRGVRRALHASRPAIPLAWGQRRRAVSSQSLG